MTCIDCACGRHYTLSGFRKLGRLAVTVIDDGEEPSVLESRQCQDCESHLSIMLLSDGTPAGLEDDES